MKNKLNKHFIVLIAIILFSYTYTFSQNNNIDAKISYKFAQKWSKTGEWKNGFKPTPYKATDYQEFYNQYHKNKELWNKLFNWLGCHDLVTIPAGQYTIDGERCFVKISDPMTRPLSQCKIESHRHYIDLQYVAQGTERFGHVKNMNDATPLAPYKPDIINYNSDKVKFMNSTPDIFFLFFPRNLHLAMGQAKKNPEKVRLIVAKIEYVK